MASKELISTVEEIENRAVDGVLDLKNIQFLYKLCVLSFWEEKDWQYGLEISGKGKKYLDKLLEINGLTFRQADEYCLDRKISIPEIDLYWKFILEETFYDFESFVFYMERNRPFSKKFYAPRQYTKDGKYALKTVADALQDLEERKYKFLGISQPARTGKSTICIFFLCWKSLRHPNDHNAMVGHSGALVKGFFKELMNLIIDPEYTFNEIYEHFWQGHTMLRDKSAEDYTITLDEPDRFATLTCRSIEGTLTGAVDVSRYGVLYIDDLVRDRQHSLSPTRMEETFQEYLNKCVDRKQDGAQELMVGTLWNVLDPLERLSKIYANDPEYKFLRLPALDDNDESNFDYVLNGFPTAYYLDMRSRLDNAEWQAKYQQRPYVREGLLFPLDELIYFDGLVKIEDIKRVYSVVDSAVGGGDNVSSPICYEMVDGRKLICKWIYDKRTVKFTVPKVVNAFKEQGVTETRVEKNGVGALYVDKVKEYIKEKNIIGIKVVPVSAPNRMSKEDKINGYSDAIKNNYQFIAPKVTRPEEVPDGYLFFERDADYNNALGDMGMYTSEGKNMCDDAPDSMAQLAIMDEGKKNGQIEVIHDLFGTGGYNVW